MSKKIKAEKDGIYFLGNNCNDVTGSMILIVFNGKQILLEAGLTQGGGDYLESYKLNSEKFKFNPRDIDYIFWGHSHCDHTAITPRVVKEGFKGKIIATDVTARLTEKLLLNSAFILGSEARCLSKKYKRNYLPIYDETAVYQTMDFVYEMPEYDKIYKLDEVVSFKWIKNSHILGAATLELFLTNSLGVTNKILYTSDMGKLEKENHYTTDMEICEDNVSVAIMESTYGEKTRVSNRVRMKDAELLKENIKNVTERGGSVIIPCFSLGRSQEMATMLWEIFHNDKTFKYDVIMDSALTCQINDVYSEVLSGEDRKLWEKVRNWENIREIREKSESDICVKNETPKIVISSSGFCQNGRIINWLKKYLADAKSMIVFSGFAGTNNSFLSYRIKNAKEHDSIKINGDMIPNRASVLTLTSMSSHSTRKDLIKIGSSLNTSKLVLVHGSNEAKTDLKPDLEKELSKANKSTKVVISSKDMVIKL